MRRTPPGVSPSRHPLSLSAALLLALLLGGCGQAGSSTDASAHLSKAQMQRIELLQDPYLHDVQALDLPLRRLDLALGASNPDNLAALARPARLSLRKVAQLLGGLAHQAPQSLSADLREESGSLNAEATAIEELATAHGREQLKRAVASYDRASAATSRITATTQQALEIVGQG